MSIPLHFCEWDVRRAATLRVLIWLWEFADRELDDKWCFQTDDQVIDGCKLRDGRHLRECLRDLREAKIAFREIGPCGRPGFHLYNRVPLCGGSPPFRRRKSAAPPC